ncbi:hypothetical protein Q9K02_12900 [Qipengyuania sp. G39]|uniref:Uncharacterized protein n=1 Tax=Qipengyuania profundimaris TaxID=3067652 RepID=A0ABT9HSA2_9SPHN|nr:hypothetical protein [Qipengyuania sp. G39]MDP4576034.1 hypothetical protein [Qipengyuania sp. G39]
MTKQTDTAANAKRETKIDKVIALLKAQAGCNARRAGEGDRLAAAYDPRGNDRA